MPKILEAAAVADRVSSAVNETFQSMFKVGAAESSRQKFLDNKLKADVSGIVTMSQESAAGLLVISFPKKMICDLLSKFYGKPFTNLDNTVNMSVGELTNVIYGVAKKVMNEEGHAFGMAIPSIIVGNQHFVFAHFSGEITVMEFTTEFGVFQVYTCLKQRASATRAA
jgi:CheY-specific phosphatase CheX